MLGWGGSQPLDNVATRFETSRALGAFALYEASSVLCLALGVSIVSLCSVPVVVTLE